MKEVYVVWHFWLEHAQNSKFWYLDEKWPTSWDFSLFFLLSFSFFLAAVVDLLLGLPDPVQIFRESINGQTPRQKSGWNNEMTTVLLFKRFILKRKLLGTLLREQRKQSTLHMSHQREFNWHKRLPKHVLHLTGWVNIAKDVYTNTCHYEIHVRMGSSRSLFSSFLPSWLTTWSSASLYILKFTLR